MKRRTWFQLTFLVVMALALVMVNVGEGGSPALDQRAQVGLHIAPLPRVRSRRCHKFEPNFDGFRL